MTQKKKARNDKRGQARTLPYVIARSGSDVAIRPELCARLDLRFFPFAWFRASADAPRMTASEVALRMI